MRVYAEGDVEGLHQSAHAAADILHGHGTCGVGDVDRVGAVGLHEQCLLDQALGGVHVGHHEEADRLHPQFLGHLDVLLGDVGLGAVHGDARDGYAELADLAEVIG